MKYLYLVSKIAVPDFEKALQKHSIDYELARKDALNFGHIFSQMQPKISY